jgi:hypothetical protein
MERWYHRLLFLVILHMLNNQSNFMIKASVVDWPVVGVNGLFSALLLARSDHTHFRTNSHLTSDRDAKSWSKNCLFSFLSNVYKGNETIRYSS